MTKAFTKDTILALSSNEDVYNRGEKYYQSGKVISYSALEDASSAIVTVEGNYKNYDVTLKFNSDDTLESSVCSCQGSAIWRGGCKHVVAALFAYMENHASSFSTGKMRQHARNLTQKLEEIIFDDINETIAVSADIHNVGSVKLEPTLYSTDRGLFFSLSVGQSRMYVVKNISGFLNSCRVGEVVTYGQGLAFAHTMDIFNEMSQKLISFLLSEDDVCGEVARRLSRQFQITHPTIAAGRDFYLTPRNIDTFFEIYIGQTVAAECDFGDKIKLVSSNPSLNMTVRHSIAGTSIMAEKLPHKLIQGKAYCYVLAEGVLYRMSKGSGQILSILLKSLDDTPKRQVLMTGEDEQRFLTMALPHLKRMGVVGAVEGKAPHIGIVSPILTRIYFDSQKNDIVGRVEFHYGDDNANINRDIVAEYMVRRRLLSLGFFEDAKLEGYRLSGDELIYQFLHGGVKGIEGLKQNAEIFVSEDLQGKTSQGKSPQVGLRLDGNLLKISLDDCGYDIAELLEALEAYRTRKKFFRLKDGRFLSMENEAVASAADFLDALDVTRKDIKGNTISVPSYKALYVNELASSMVGTHKLSLDENFQTLLDNFKEGEQLSFKLPRGLTNVLREYQKTGYNWLKTLSHYGFGGILADDMGLGKTLQIITLLASESGKWPSLVVCPTSLLFNWENEIARFAPKLVTQVISGTPERRKKLIGLKSVDVFITTYDMLKRDVDEYNKRLFNYVIADEAQNIKNPSTQAAIGLKSLNSRVRFALTGTPIENTLTELWSIFDFILPGFLHTAGRFSKLYEVPIVKYGDSAAALKLRRQIAPFVLRRIKESVLKELPEKTEKTLQAEFLPEQGLLYQAALMETVGALDEIVAQNSFQDNRMRILAQLTRLRQICCHPSLHYEDYNGGSGKLELAIETIQIALESGHRVLLFSQFTSMLGIIKEAIETNRMKTRSGRVVDYFYLDGSIKAKDRMEMTERFNAGERDLFLISLKAGGAGLNLTGADVVIHYDPWWNPSVMDQASDRAHRYGQKNVVQVINIVAKDSIEEKIMALQDKKRGLIDSVITEGGSFINLLSEEEIRKLF